MRTNKTDVARPQICKLGDYVEKRQIPAVVIQRMQDALRDEKNTVLIDVKSRRVVMMPPECLTSEAYNASYEAEVWDYEVWRSKGAETLADDYDRERYNRGTLLETLNRKVHEHKTYSFIVRCKKENDVDAVIKYSFVCLCPNDCFTLCTRQDITQSLEHDVLTGGLNRGGLLRELKHKFNLRQEGKKLALLCFNIKNFRSINELYGTKVGDSVLQHMYTSIVYSDLHPLSYARSGSDTFFALIDTENFDTSMISRLCQQECMVGEKKIVFRSVCGIYYLDDKEEISPSRACMHAKLALNYIKDQFITPWEVYDPKMQQSMITDSEVMGRLEDALRQKEFVPYYQPVVNAQTGQIEMAEALVRWKSPKHGLISPALFIPVLERYGGLSRVDMIMEEVVFRLQQKRLKEGRPVVPIDLNLSWSDFADTKLVDQLRNHILDSSVPTDLMRFEITESAYEEIAENRMDVLNFFQDNDVKLLVDDFGQGYSFGTMKNVDFHIVKLDKSMIDNIDKSKKMDLLIETLVSVFHNLNAKVVAEGVEHDYQVEFLRKVGCDYIQGYYFFKPMDEQSFLELIDSQQGKNLISAESKDEKQSDLQQDKPNAVWVDREVLEQQYAKMEQSFEESRGLRMLLDEMDMHIFEWDVKTHEDIASDKFCKIYGLPSNVIPNMPEDCPLVLPEDRDRFKAFYNRIACGERMGSDCFRLFRPDGNGYTWFRKTFYTLYDSKGKPYKAIITMHDSQDEYRYRMLKTRDKMLTQQHEIVTFIYTLSDDTITLTYKTATGEVSTKKVTNFLSTSPEKMFGDQALIAENLRRSIAENKKSGYFDFNFPALNAEFRAHFAMVEGEYGHLYAVIGQAEDIKKTRERLMAADQLIRMSKIDSLTQIRNRYSGEEEMSLLLEEHKPGVFGILDCDNFKVVNDTFGHVTGDQLLKAIAKTMETVNPNGINMRLGGDEFAFCLSGMLTKDDMMEGTSRFFKLLENLKVPGMEGYPVSVSVGAVLYDGNGDVNFDSLYRQADELLYESKKTPGNKLSM